MFTKLEIPAGRRPLSSGEKTGVAAATIVFGGLMAASLLENFSPEKLSAVFFLIFWAIMLVVHEVGHAVAAWAVDWRVRQIVIGFGPTLFRGRFGETDVQVNLVAVSGFVVPDPLSRAKYRLKNAFVYAAGPGSEFLLRGVLLLAFGWDSVFGPSKELHFIALKTLAWVIVIGGGFNLLPFASDGMASDGLGICLSPLLKDSDIEARLVSHDCERIEKLLQREEIDNARHVCCAGLAKFPDNPRLMLLAIEISAAREGVESGLDEINALLARDDFQSPRPKWWPAELWLLRAQLELRADEPSSMDIDRSLDRAENHGVAPVDWMIVKGAALVERGLYEPGGNLLTNAFRRLGESDKKADGTILAWLAIAAKHVGDRVAAIRFLRALEYTPPPPWLQKKLQRIFG